MSRRAAATLTTPIGELLLVSDGEALTAVQFDDGRRGSPTPDGGGDPVLVEASAQLRAYFAGERTAFDLPLRAAGTPFEHGVWDELRRIPYGETTSYGELAARVGEPSAARAVGRANGRNPIPIIVPCHRVIGADGSLTGFGGGLECKRALLDLESGALSLRLA
jgi:methylated-DNA-[protein]-cysteine S-methyltransferase